MGCLMGWRISLVSTCFVYFLLRSERAWRITPRGAFAALPRLGWLFLRCELYGQHLAYSVTHPRRRNLLPSQTDNCDFRLTMQKSLRGCMTFFRITPQLQATFISRFAATKSDETRSWITCAIQPQTSFRTALARNGRKDLRHRSTTTSLITSVNSQPAHRRRATKPISEYFTKFDF